MNKIRGLIEKYKALSLRDRAQYTAKITVIGNLVMVLSKLAIGIFTLSIFFIVSGIFSLGIGICKIIYLIGDKKSNRNIAKERMYFLLMGIILLLASVFYIVYMIRLFFVDSTFVFELIPSIVIAMVSFTELIVSIIGLTKSNKNRDLLLSGLKCVNLASALTAMVMTQVTLIYAVSLENADATINSSLYNAVSGVCFGGICVVIGVLMILYFVLTQKTNFSIEILIRRKNMICKKCGKRLPSMALICTKCGAILDLDDTNLDGYNYDYLVVKASADTVVDVANYYKSLGYELGGNREGYGSNGITLFLRRQKEIRNKEVLKNLEEQLDTKVKKILSHERSMLLLPFTIVIFLGLLGLGIIAGGILMTILGSGTGLLVGGIALAILGLLVIGVSYPIYNRLHNKKHNEIYPLIEKEKDEIECLLQINK